MKMKSSVIGRLAAHIDARGRKLPLASEEAVCAAEVELGLSIPALLRSVYLHVANGGFGPGYGVVGESACGYGIIGVAGGHRSSRGTLVETFNDVKRGVDHLGLKWNPQLLPFCELGGAVYFCVDCSSPGNPIFLSDHCKARPANCDLEGFFEKWLDGKDLLEDGPSRRTIEMTNPFTGKKTRIRSI